MKLHDFDDVTLDTQYYRIKCWELMLRNDDFIRWAGISQRWTRKSSARFFLSKRELKNGGLSSMNALSLKLIWRIELFKRGQFSAPMTKTASSFGSNPLRKSPRSSSSSLSCLATTRWKVDPGRLYYMPSQFKLLNSVVLLWLAYQVHQPRTWYEESAVFIRACDCSLRIPTTWLCVEGADWQKGNSFSEWTISGLPW